jgi:hypothetical protein
MLATDLLLVETIYNGTTRFELDPFDFFGFLLESLKGRKT